MPNIGYVCSALRVQFLSYVASITVRYVYHVVNDRTCCYNPTLNSAYTSRILWNSDVLIGCGAERSDGARRRLSWSSDELCSHVAVSWHVYRHFHLFPPARNHPHSPSLPPDVHRARHQERWPDCWLAGVHLVNLFADRWHDRGQMSQAHHYQHSAVSSAELCCSADNHLTDAGTSSSDSSCCRTTGSHANATQCFTIQHLSKRRRSRRHDSGTVSSCPNWRYPHQQLGTCRPVTERRAVQPLECHQHVSTTRPTLTIHSTHVIHHNAIFTSLIRIHVL